MGEEVASFPRDFLRRFGVAANSCGINASVEETEVGGGGRGGKGHFEDVELSLGLSLGGCFGAKPKQERLARSSSTAALPADHELPFVAPPLARTCSLPAETEEMLRKRKQLQSLKRSEAKRKRLERKKSSIPAAPAAKDANNDSGTENGRIKGLANSNRSLPPALPPWSMRIGRPRAQKVGGSNSCLPRAAPQAPVTSQGSISSGVSDDNLQNPTNKQGYVASESKENLEVRSQSKMSEQSNGSAATKHPSASVPGTGEHNGGGGGGGGGAKEEAAATKNANGNGLTKAAGRSIMESMPCVSTRGSGPNGRRIEGFLYKYRKGEEVRIVCVCHGSSLTPAEFVKHAGGGDVVNPLKHIVVSPSPMAML